MTLFRHSQLAIVLAGGVLLSFSAAAVELALGPMPISLKHLPVPPVPGLLDGPDPIVVNKNAAIALGKALFWDTNVGSDGMACASCHFHAGADGRVKNQLAPGGQSSPLSDQTFSNAMTGASLGPNHTLSIGDFPLHQREDPFQEHSAVLYNTDNVVGSSGTFGGEFRAVDRYTAPNDTCSRSVDSLFHAGAVGTRKVTPRNAPSVINAVFNHRNFWDGRANNVFNGSSPWGDRDPDAGVWVKQNATTLIKQRLHLINSSLASLAVAPPQNTTEMACRNRTLMELGRKLLLRRPLQNQKVHPEDSVLGPYSLNSKPGTNTLYKLLIMQAFNPKYWSYSGNPPIPAPKGFAPYNQTEANFGMFFGLAIQLYESTLISDESPFDNSARDTGNQPIELSASELNGLKQFRKNQCALCHLGPNFSAASINANAAIAKTHPEAFGEPTFFISASTNVVNRIPLLIKNTPVTAFFDTGFSSTGVTEETADIGAGGVDDFGNPLSFSRQYLQHLAGNNAAALDEDVTKVRACDFQEALALNIKLPYSLPSLFTITDGIRPQPQSTENCFLPANNAFLPTTAAALAELNKPNTRKMVASVDSTFKIPSLRNIELTGPYMHNGSMATLEQAIEFYSRGGNFAYDSKQVTRVFPQPNLQLDAQNRADLIAFLKTLTDERVRYEKAPFDHPEIKIPHGHVGVEQTVSGGNPLGAVLGKDEFLTIDAVGAQGNSSPIQPFEAYLAP
ncbi:cytochrome-c peroxidase [Methylomonas sp. EFPC1]|uniref:cytochrome-c peroxidase n=1 Tax=Methylomonas sp. EFPC1 TaxID=2812647 RepID=UPI0019679758|nr:cytochrome c peroxidase [Methylomonas sp. EFPC1]QSA99509.1 cytochrome-c peroxidase [Methylomonas sp. EFPC1]